MWQVFEGVAASKKHAMHVAAKEALHVITQPAGGNSDGGTSDVTLTKNSPASKVLPAIASGKNPVMIINEVYPDAEFSLVSESGEGLTKSFVMSLRVEEQSFQGSGRNKRLAKAYAAQAALCQLYGVVSFASPGELHSLLTDSTVSLARCRMRGC